MPLTWQGLESCWRQISGMSVREFLDCVNWGRKTHPNHGLHHSLSWGPRMNRKEKAAFSQFLELERRSLSFHWKADFLLSHLCSPHKFRLPWLVIESYWNSYIVIIINCIRLSLLPDFDAMWPATSFSYWHIFLDTVDSTQQTVSKRNPPILKLSETGIFS